MLPKGFKEKYYIALKGMTNKFTRNEDICVKCTHNNNTECTILLNFLRDSKYAKNCDITLTEYRDGR